MMLCTHWCLDPGPGRKQECAVKTYVHAMPEGCGCPCHQQTVEDMLDARDTQILRLRARLVDTEYALASVIAGIEAGGDPVALAADARAQGAPEWVEKALRMGNTSPVREAP